MVAAVDTSPLVIVATSKRAMFKRMLYWLKELVDRTEAVRYFSVPLWRPWRAF